MKTDVLLGQAERKFKTGNYGRLLLKELKVLLKSRCLKVTGNKPDLVKRLLDHESSVAAASGARAATATTLPSALQRKRKRHQSPHGF